MEPEEESFEELHYYSAYLTKGLWPKRKNIDSIQNMTTGYEGNN